MRMNAEPANHLSSVLCLLSSGAGFTLIELVMVIVILGIVGVMGADFISQAFRGFVDTNDRMEIYEEGKIALVRMEREIRNAVPNAIYVDPSDPDTISFGVIDETTMNNSGVFGQYSGPDSTGTKITDRSNPAAGLPAGTLVSIYNTSWENFDNLDVPNTPPRIYAVQSVDPGSKEMTLGSSIEESSPNQRFYAVKGKAIQYSVSGDRTLNRTSADVLTTGVDLNSFGDPQPLARGIEPAKNPADGSDMDYFTYSAGTLERNGLVVINFAIKKRDTTISFHKEVHVRNVP